MRCYRNLCARVDAVPCHIPNSLELASGIAHVNLVLAFAVLNCSLANIGPLTYSTEQVNRSGNVVMVTSPAQKGRSSVACKACHGQKLKCNGEPIQTDVRSPDFAAPMSPPKTSRIIKEEMPEDCSTEKFFHTLLSRKEKYTYSRLKFDFLHPEVHLRLPPRPYAFHLLQAFEEGFSEYHWFLRKDFRDRLMLTYSDPSSQSKDRNWLCRVSVVLALAESFNRSRMTASTHMQLTGEQPPSPYGILPPVSSSPTSNSESSETPQAPPPPPGSDYFEQGLMLLKMSSEEPVSEDVEALNLILCEIKRHVVITAAQHSDVDDERRLDIIKPCIDMLHDWRANLPSNMTFTFEDSLPTRLMEAQYGRILASIYMRYHQASCHLG
ncbi:hypothetical protein K4K48_002855 [Colletotrichum sp. SAR 10_66]|nr:hypothetical protein K4K48_002855 [Colletotrichum sp. SAR 10_66]